MRVDLGRYGIWRRVNEITPVLAAEAEELGYGAIWLGGSPSGDLTDVDSILAATSRIPVVTGIVNMWREDASTVGTAYLRIAEQHPDRFVLGVGVGHPESTREYERPIDKIAAYLDRLDDIGVPRDRTILAALGPKVLRLSAERTAGAHPYLTTPRHTEYARQVLGPDALLAPEHKVMTGATVEEARALGRSVAARYLRLVNYRNNLIREGWSPGDFEDGGSDRLIDALVLHGDIDHVAARLNEHLRAGADHVCIQALGEDPSVAHRELASVLLG